MATHDTDKLQQLTNRLFAWVMATGSLLAIVLFAGGYLLTGPLVLQEALRQLAIIVVGVVIVSLMQVKLLGDFYREQSRAAITPDLENVETRLVEEFRHVIPELEAKTTQSINDIRDRVTEATNFMLNGIEVLTGAKNAGIVNIFPNRYQEVSGHTVMDVIRKDLQAENSTIRLMGISLGDYFLDRGVLHTSLVHVLERPGSGALKIKALLVHPKCDTLRERARWEAGPEYHSEPAFFDSTTFIETDGAARIAKRLSEKHPGILDVHLYHQAPTAFVLLTSRFVFIESYNYADRGSKVPVIQVQAGAELYHHYESHFERIWTVSDPISEYNPFRPDRKHPLR